MRKNRCFICGAEVDEATRFNSLQHFNHVVCSMECGIKSNESDMIEQDIIEGVK